MVGLDGDDLPSTNHSADRKTFALMPPRPGTGMALNDDDDDFLNTTQFFKNEA